jgi:hypothetical protein
MIEHLFYDCQTEYTPGRVCGKGALHVPKIDRVEEGGYFSLRVP